MKRIYEFITKANQILLFIVVLGAMTAVIAILREQFFRQRTPPRVPIAQSPDEIKRIKVSDVRWLGSVSGVEYFGIVQRAISGSTEQEPIELQKSHITGGDYESAEQTVNIAMSNSSNNVHKLLSHDGFVLNYALASKEYGHDQFHASTFLCITEDTNGDHALDRRDRADLYVVPTNSENPQFVEKGVVGHFTRSDSTLIVKTVESDGIHFTEINVDTRVRTELHWK